MNNPYLSMLATAWRYARHERKRYILIYSMFVLANLTAAAHPLLYGYFVDSLQRDGSNVLSYAWVYGLGYLGLRVVEWCFHGPARVMERKLAFNVSRNFLDELYHKVLHLPMKWHQDNHTGATISRMQKAYGALKSFFQSGFAYLHALFKFIFSFAAMLYFAPVFGLIGVLLGFLTVWVIFKFDKPYIRSLKEVNERDHKVYSTLFDSLSNIVTVITLRLEKRMETSFMNKVMDVFPAFRRNITINEWKWFTAQMLIALIYAIIVVGYVYQNYVPGETFYMGGLIILLGYVSQFTSVFNDIAAQYTQITQFNTDVQTAHKIAEAYNQEHRPEATSDLPADWQSLSISNLNFTRPDNGLGQKRFSGLRDLHMRIQRGQRIALIGESGSGKSTLLSLLRGLYVPQDGVQVCVDDDLTVDFESIRNTVTLFPQEPEIFENTLLYNITLGLPFSEEEVMQVCEVAQFSEIIRQLPDGLDTVIQEKGANFSGGQRQRLALARGILAARSSSIILMDEPTSSVDPRTEMLLYNKLFKAFAGKAVVSSLHRLHLLSQFDYIYILQNGRVIEEGTFEILRYNSEIFQEMWRHQQERTDSNAPGQATAKVPTQLVRPIS
jgi:ABC-type multidrug transport system fused ATPase/permease subunit